MPLAAPRHAAARGRLLRQPAVAAIAGLILLAACSPASPTPPPPSLPASSLTPALGSPSASPSTAPSPSPSSTAMLLLEVRSEGGFINPAASIGALPTAVVDTDGRIYTPGPAPDGSAPLIPVVQVRDTGPTGAAAILAAATAAGLADGSASGGGLGADTGATVFTLEADGREVVTPVAAGGPIGGPGIHPGASGAASGSPAAALDLVARLSDTTTSWGGSAGVVAVYQPTAYRVWTARAPSGSDLHKSAPWPLDPDPGSFGSPAAASLGVDGLRSGVVSGADALALARALGSVEAGTLLVAGGTAYEVWVQPLLPDELGG